MGNNPETGSAEGGVGKAQPNWGVGRATAKALGSTAIAGYASARTATASKAGSIAIRASK